MKSISHQKSTETTSQTRTDRTPRAVTSAPPGALTPDLPQGPHRHLSPSLRVAHPTLPLSFMVAVWAACGMCCLQQQSGMGHWNSKATVTTDRMLGESQSQDKTGICLCQRQELDEHLGMWIWAAEWLAWQHPPPITVLRSRRKCPCFLEARVPQVVSWGGGGLPLLGPVQFYLESGIL